MLIGKFPSPQEIRLELLAMGPYIWDCEVLIKSTAGIFYMIWGSIKWMLSCIGSKTSRMMPLQSNTGLDSVLGYLIYYEIDATGTYIVY